MKAAWMMGALLALGAVGCAGDETYVAGPRYPGAYGYGYDEREEMRDDARDIRQNTREGARDVRQDVREGERDRQYHRQDMRQNTRSNVRQQRNK
jgi:hypothetical protein